MGMQIGTSVCIHAGSGMIPWLKEQDGIEDLLNPLIQMIFHSVAAPQSLCLRMTKRPTTLGDSLSVLAQTTTIAVSI